MSKDLHVSRNDSIASTIEHRVGPADAAVVIVEYVDFECPLCAQARPATRLLLETHPNDVRLVVRHFPLRDAHPHAEYAAEAAEAAAAQGKFWEMADLLFENQLHLKPRSIRQYAERLELDLLRFDAEMADHVYLQRVQEHVASGIAAGVRATPGFFVNGEVVDVSFDLETLFAAVRHSLKH